MEFNPLLLGSLMPHPPLLIPEIGGAELGHIRHTQDAMRDLSREIVALSPDVLIIISPHGPMFEDAVAVMGGTRLEGNLQEFGTPLHFSFPSDTELADYIVALSRGQDVPIHLIDEEIKQEFGINMELDYGATVPLFYLQEAGYRGAILHISPGLLPVETLYAAGSCIQTALHQLKRKAVVIASGDNSHSLAEDAPAGYTPEGEAFDQILQLSIERSEWRSLFTQDPAFLEQAAEDTVPSCALLFGIFDQIGVRGDVLSYEGPFGVGYTVARFTPGPEVPSLYKDLQAARFAQFANIRANESPLVQLARHALEAYVRDQTEIASPSPLPTDWARPAGCYVTIHQHGQLRGCIGTTEPATDNLASEIIVNAIAAGTEDDRYFPIEEDELDELTYTVSVIERPEPLTDFTQLDPRRYGLIAEKGDRYALLLPDLPNVRTVAEQLEAIHEKANLDPSEPDIHYYRFRTTKHM